MRKMILALLALTALLAACTAGATEPTLQDENGNTNDTGDTPALNPVAPDAESYPAAATPVPDDAYPAAPVESGLPTGYPDLTIVAPSGSVDLGQLTPVAGDPTPRVAPSPGRPNQPGGVQAGVLLEATISDLSALTEAYPSAIEVISVEPIVWPDGGLGCPAEGMAYAQVQVEGSIITLRVSNDTYTYHTAGSGEYVLCQNGTRMSEGVVPRGG